MEQDIVKERTEMLVDELFDFKNFLPDTAKFPISMALKNVKAPNMEKEDAEVREKNSKLKKQAFTAIGIGNAIAIALVATLYFYKKFDIKDLLIHNLIILVFVGLTELSFLLFIGKFYIAVDPNYVKYHMIKTINESIN